MKAILYRPGLHSVTETHPLAASAQTLDGGLEATFHARDGSPRDSIGSGDSTPSGKLTCHVFGRKNRITAPRTELLAYVERRLWHGKPLVEVGRAA